MMAYQNNFVVSIIHNGKPIREFAESGQRTCVLPFGSEYKVRLKNKTNKRAKAKVYIDGMDTLTNGGYFILGANQTLDLERFVDDFKEGRKLKFISLEQGTATGEIQDPTSPDNGWIKVEFYPEDDTTERFKKMMEDLDKFQKEQEKKDWNPWTQRPSVTWNSSGTKYGTTLTNCGGSLSKGLLRSSVHDGMEAIQSAFNASVDVSTNSTTASAGATVEGSHSQQQFMMSYEHFDTLTPTTITLKLRGPVVETSIQVGMEVLFGSGGLITVRMNGKTFVSSTDYGVKIMLSDEGLSITGKGIDIKTKDYKVVTV